MKNRTLIYFSIFLLFCSTVVHGAIPNNPIDIESSVISIESTTSTLKTPKAGEIIFFKNDPSIMESATDHVLVQQAKDGKYYLIIDKLYAFQTIGATFTNQEDANNYLESELVNLKKSDSTSPYIISRLEEPYFRELINIFQNFLLLKLNIKPTKEEIEIAQVVMGYFRSRLNNNEALNVAQRLDILQAIVLRRPLFYSAWENVKANINNLKFNQLMQESKEPSIMPRYNLSISRNNLATVAVDIEGVAFQRYLKDVATQPVEQFIEPVKKILKEMFRVAKTKYHIPDMLVLESVLKHPNRYNLDKAQDWINNEIVHNVMQVYNKATEEGKGLVILTSLSFTENSPLFEKLQSRVDVSRCEKGFSPHVTGIML